MARDEPLLAPRPSSENSSIRNEEEDALLTGQRTQRPVDAGRRSWVFWREIGLFIWAVVATAAVIILAVVYQHNLSTSKDADRPVGKRNVIFMVSDGMGPTSLSMTRSFRQFESGLPIDDVLVLDQHHIGSSRTRSSSSLVTDSAAGATAFSCGLKSYNGAISVLPDHSPCGTVLEAAKEAGYMTGLVVTTRITDATPACFAAHVNQRGYEDRIAEQEVGEHPLGRVVDLMLGGGRCFFLPNTTEGSCRSDDRDIIELAKDNQFNYIDDRKAFDALEGGDSVSLPLLGLFAERNFPYEIDRRHVDDVYPSLEEMARTALKALSDATKDSDQGFFIMIEGSRIDHAGHGNDPAAQVHEVLAYDRAFAAALEFLENDDTDGVLVSTSDHETGGLAAARQLHESYPEYVWYPEVLANASYSSEQLGYEVGDYLDGPGKDDDQSTQRKHIRKYIVEEGLGIKDSTDKEIDSLIDGGGSYALADIISRRAQIGWSTHGHSAADVSIFASSPKAAGPIVGNVENIEVGSFLADYLSLDVGAITKKLQAFTSVSTESNSYGEGEYGWLGDPLGEDILVDELDSYHGDFRKRSLKRNADGDLVETAPCGCH
ncbi:hypothetical protein FQN54_005006 [Arachnomyces sp. PD_36]|nr:hypothetical protein FQN54_005006 [Arachnomyces sp. PD_36]